MIQRNHKKKTTLDRFTGRLSTKLSAAILMPYKLEYQQQQQQQQYNQFVLLAYFVQIFPCLFDALRLILGPSIISFICYNIYKL